MNYPRPTASRQKNAVFCFMNEEHFPLPRAQNTQKSYSLRKDKLFHIKKIKLGKRN